MRKLMVLAALLAGCTIQVERPAPAATGKPGVRATTGSPAPAAQVPLTGIWALATERDAKGPRTVTACENFRRYEFTPRNGVVEVAGTDAGPRRSRGYDNEALVVVAGADAMRWKLEGQRSTPGPTDGPVPRPISYELTYDTKARTLTGTRRSDGGEPEAVRLVQVEGELLPCPSPDPTAAPSVPPAATAAPSSPSPAPTPTIGLGDVVLRYRTSGGLCPGGPCGAVVTLHADGRFTRDAGANDQAEGRIDRALAAAVAAEIYRTDFAAIKAKPFTGTCPTAYDGQEVTYTFDTPTGEEVLPSCTYALDPAHPLLKAAEAAYAATAR